MPNLSLYAFRSLTRSLKLEVILVPSFFPLATVDFEANSLGGKLICVRGIAPVTVLRLRSSSLPLFASGGYPIEGGEDHFRLGVPVKHNGQYHLGIVCSPGWSHDDDVERNPGRGEEGASPLRVKVIKAPWLFCPAENALQNRGVLPGSLGRALVGYHLTKSRPARGKAQAGRNLFCPGDGRLRNICLVLLLFFALCSSVGTSPQQARSCCQQHSTLSLLTSAP